MISNSDKSQQPRTKDGPWEGQDRSKGVPPELLKKQVGNETCNTLTVFDKLFQNGSRSLNKCRIVDDIARCLPHHLGDEF